MSLQTQQYMDALISHALSLGYFDSVNPVDIGSTPPNTGLTAVLWPGRGRALPGGSGLNVTSVSVTFTMRLFNSMNSDPMGQIDPLMITATDELLNAYSGHFTLGGLINYIDLIGEHGDSLGFDSGFLKTNDEMFRIVDITIPLIIHDIWTQEG